MTTKTGKSVRATLARCSWRRVDSDLPGYSSFAHPRRGEDPATFADRHVSDDDPRVDRWGPACCVSVGPGDWLFFGLASS